MAKLNAEQLRQAADLQEQIETLQGKLDKMLSGEADGRTFRSFTTRRQLSPEAKAKIAAGQKKRWAKFHSQQKNAK